MPPPSNAEYGKRSEVTIETMGRVHNPSGEGVRMISSQVQGKVKRFQEKQAAAADEAPKDKEHHSSSKEDPHETKNTKEGSAKRNIVRKKTDSRDSGHYDSRNKKQGGAGKGKWREDDVVLDESEYAGPLNENDPLYVPEEDAPYILSSARTEEQQKVYDNGTVLYGPLLTESEFKLQAAEIFKEYFNSSDPEEVVQSILELKCRDYHCHLVKKVISLSLDQHPREREWTSRLLTYLHPSPLTDEEMLQGFDILLDGVDDLTMDVPDAPVMVANFVARAVVDEVLPPAYLSHQNNRRPGDMVVEKAIALLSREHCNARLERVWGPGDGRPVAELKVELDQLLEEYLLSRELDECARCVKELDASHYMHELVKRGLKIAMECDGKKSDDDDGTSCNNLDAMAALFGFLVKNAIIAESQVHKGVDRTKKSLDDIQLDVPAAPQLMVDFEAMLKDVLPKSTTTTTTTAS